MDNLKIASLIGLILLFVLAQIATFVFKITRDHFYRPFHFAGGFLTASLIYSINPNILIVILGTLLVGVLWEVYEYMLWRFILKDDRFKQEREDTIEDIALGFLGGLAAVVIFLLNNF